MLWLVAATAVATGSLKLALPDPQTVNVPAETAAFLGEDLARRLRDEGVDVVTAREMSSLVGGVRERALAGCTENDPACVLELASALGSDGVVMIDIARLGDLLRVIVKVVSASDGRTLATCSDRSANADQAADALKPCAHKLAAELRDAVSPARGASWLRVSGFIGLGVGAIAAGVGGALFALGSADFAQLSGAHSPPITWSQATALAGAGRAREQAGVGLLVVAGAIAVVAAVLVAFGWTSR